MASKCVNISFYLTLFEKEMEPHNSTTDYLLKDFALREFAGELHRFGIGKSIENSSILNLQKISSHRS